MEKCRRLKSCPRLDEFNSATRKAESREAVAWQTYDSRGVRVSPGGIGLSDRRAALKEETLSRSVAPGSQSGVSAPHACLHERPWSGSRDCSKYPRRRNVFSLQTSKACRHHINCTQETKILQLEPKFLESKDLANSSAIRIPTEPSDVLVQPPWPLFGQPLTRYEQGTAYRQFTAEKGFCPTRDGVKMTRISESISDEWRWRPSGLLLRGNVVSELLKPRDMTVKLILIIMIPF